jgi:cytochrome b561
MKRFGSAAWNGGPLVGWGTLSADRYPIVLYGRFSYPRSCHTTSRCVRGCDPCTPISHICSSSRSFAHFGAALFHGLIRRDRVFESMASWPGRASK